MARSKLPRLADTARRYLDGTMRARLASPGVERFRVERASRTLPLVAAGVLFAAAVAGLAWFTAGR